MCCIIHRPKNTKEIPLSNLEKIIKINSDGWGSSYMKDGKLQVTKSLVMEDAIEHIRKLEKENVEFLFHARYTTHGDNIIENCHPYNLTNGVLFHNGKIDVFCRNKKYSDTYYFSLKVNKFLRKRRTIDEIVTKFKRIIGPSRLAFMTNEGEVIKFGTWHYEDGCKYSKLNWKYHGSSGWTSGYDGWDNHGNYSSGVQQSFASLSDAYKRDQLFLEVMTKCKKGDSLLTFEAKSLSHSELIIIARKYPQIAARFLVTI